MTLREDYNRDGYVKIESCLSLSQVASLTDLDFKSVLSDSVDRYVSLLTMIAKLSVVQRLFLQEIIFESLNKLGIKAGVIISQPVLHVMSQFLRIPNGYYGTAAHQDWASTQGSLDCVTVWIALTDITLNNFPLEVIPGSHKRGLLDGKMNGSVLEVEADDKEFIPIECKAGDVVFLSGFTVHRTGKGNGFRVAVSQRFDNATEPTFIERGYPCAQKRVVDREIGWKPTVEQVRRIYEY